MCGKSEELRNGGVAGPVDSWEEKDLGKEKRIVINVCLVIRIRSELKAI